MNTNPTRTLTLVSLLSQQHYAFLSACTSNKVIHLLLYMQCHPSIVFQPQPFHSHIPLSDALYHPAEYPAVTVIRAHALFFLNNLCLGMETQCKILLY